MKVHNCLCIVAALAVVFVLDSVSCQIQDTDDVIDVPEMDVNVLSTVRPVITQQQNVTLENDTVTFCDSFVTMENVENVTWPRSSVGSTVGVILQESICGAQIFKDCMEGGKWNVTLEQVPEKCLADKVIQIIVFVVYGVSLAACISAFVIFVLIRSSLRGVGHYQYHIHWNFVTSFILFLVVFFIVFTLKTAFLQENLWLLNTLTVLLAYSVLANFFWMLVEGLVLFVLVATSFPGSQRGRAFVKWLLIGWGIPAFLVSGWAIAEKAMSSAESKFVLELGATKATNYVFLIGPTLVALVINAIVLVVVMRILWQKLKDDARNTTSMGSREKSSWRAAKSTFVILILLGVYFALPIVVNLFEPPFLVSYIIANVGYLVSSLQGLLVCTLYVFCNAEVRRALRNVRRRLRSSSHLTVSTRLSSPTFSRSATPRQSKSHSSSEGSGYGKQKPCRKPDDLVDSIEGAAPSETKRQTCVVMESLDEYPSVALVRKQILQMSEI